MSRWIVGFGIVGLACLAAGASAQEATRTFGFETATTLAAVPANADKAVPPATRFEELPAKDREIAKTIFFSQRATAMGPPVWSLNRIATARQSGRSWKGICKNLYDRGLLKHPDPGRIIDAYNRQQSLHPLPSRTIVTTGTGQSIVIDAGVNNADPGRKAGSESSDELAAFSYLSGFGGDGGIEYGIAGAGIGAMFTNADSDLPQDADSPRFDQSTK